MTPIPPRTPRRHRGVAVFLVLLLLSMTLALSYAMVRTQSTSAQLQRNSNRCSAARQAAVTGLTLATKKMSGDDWAGVGSTFAGSLNAYDGFRVTYTAGDPTLVAGSSDYGDLPYRVTLLATGSSVDPDTPQSIAVHRIRAVVRLVPRKLAAAPSDWSTIQQYTLYQSKKRTCQFDLPCRIEGPARFQEKLRFAVNYPWEDEAWRGYLDDLNNMRAFGYGDHRPFTGPIHLPVAVQSSKHLSALVNLLNTSVVDRSALETGNWGAISATTYRIYDGGPVYDVPLLTGTVQERSLAPDPATNPLGIFRCSDAFLTLGAGARLRGSLLCNGDLDVRGANVVLEPLDLPPLYGSQNPVRLPVVCCRDFTIKPAAGGSLTGLLAALGAFKVEQGSETAAFAMVGRFIAAQFTIEPRTEWSGMDWNACWSQFLSQPLFGRIWWFPQWMSSKKGRNPAPKLTFKPDPTPVVYSWFNTSSPIYVADPNDGGLRWDVLDWTENPE